MHTRFKLREGEKSSKEHAPDFSLRQVLRDSIRRSRKDRAQIAEEMKHTLGLKVSKAMLDNYTADHDTKGKFPAFFIDGFCRAVGDDALQRLVMGPRLAGLVRLGEALLAVAEFDPKAARLARRLQRRPRTPRKGSRP